MTDNSDTNSETPFGRLIREAKEEAFHARRKLRREQPNPSFNTKRSVAEALADYHDVLEDYADERALQTAWNERIPVDCDALLDETTTLDRPISSRNRDAAEPATVPAVANLSARELLTLAKELDKIAKELGFAAEAKQPTPHEEASMSDLRGLLEARGQSEALDNLPDTDTSSESGSEQAVTDGGEPT